MIRLLTLFIFMSSLTSCTEEANNNNVKAYLNIIYFDKFNNEVDSGHIQFLNHNEPLNSYFEYINDEHAHQKCSQQISKIATDREYFKLTYYANKSFYSEKDEMADFNRISKLKFQCHIETIENNKECKEKYIIRQAKKELSKRNNNESKISSEEAEEIFANVMFASKLNDVFGLCKYRVIGETLIFNIDELLK